MPTCLITGANGFIGQALCEYLLARNFNIHAAVRKAWSSAPNKVSVYNTGDINESTDWTKPLEQVDSVIHLAGTVHRPDIQDKSIYQRSIVAATNHLAEQAIAAGVKRFVYVSSSHVYGVEASDIAITETHPCHPVTPYGLAKLQAEELLQQQMKNSAMEIVIVRPPLVYGKDVRGNFAQLIQLVKKLPFLPLGCATKRRSLVGLHNLITFLHCCLEHPQAANAVFNISDDHDLSTRALCEKLAAVLGKKPIFIAISAAWMKLALTLCGKKSLFTKLFESVCLDISAAKNQLGWKPIYTIEDELKNI